MEANVLYGDVGHYYLPGENFPYSSTVILPDIQQEEKVNDYK